MNKKNPTRTIEETIFTKTIKQDKFGRDYLLLELGNKEIIFVFPSKIISRKWPQLNEGERYEFTVEEGANCSNLLVDFFSLGSIII